MTDPGPAKSRLAADRDQTLDRLAELEREFAAIVTSASEGSAGGDDEHDPEGATVAFERQHIAALAAQAREHLAAIDAALTENRFRHIRNMRYVRWPDRRGTSRRPPRVPHLRSLRRNETLALHIRRPLFASPVTMH